MPFQDTSSFTTKHPLSGKNLVKTATGYEMLVQIPGLEMTLPPGLPARGSVHAAERRRLTGARGRLTAKLY